MEVCRSSAPRGRGDLANEPDAQSNDAYPWLKMNRCFPLFSLSYTLTLPSIFLLIVAASCLLACPLYVCQNVIGLPVSQKRGSASLGLNPSRQAKEPLLGSARHLVLNPPSSPQNRQTTFDLGPTRLGQFGTKPTRANLLPCLVACFFVSVGIRRAGPHRRDSPHALPNREEPPPPLPRSVPVEPAEEPAHSSTVSDTEKKK